MLKAEFFGSNGIKLEEEAIKEYYTNSPVSSFCRDLVNQGYMDQPVEFYRDNVAVLLVKSLHKQAKLTLSEDRSLNYVKCNTLKLKEINDPQTNT